MVYAFLKQALLTIFVIRDFPFLTSNSNVMSAQIEPILAENKDRFVIFPIKHNDIWQLYKSCEASFWTAEEIDLHQDLTDWSEKLNDDER